MSNQQAAGEPLMKDATAVQVEGANNNGNNPQQQGGGAYNVNNEKVTVGAPDKFIGLSKEELEHYRNDPFWRNLRYFLFALFWIAWIAMFAAAIAIVATSDPCPAKFEPKWYQQKLSYQVWTPSFKDSDGDGLGDIAGIEEKISDVRAMKVSALWATPLLAGTSKQMFTGGVTDHTKVDPAFGTNQQLTSLIDAIHSKGMYFIMDIPMTTSSEHIWFENSKSNVAKYLNAYRFGNGSPGYWTPSSGPRPGSYLHKKGNPNLPALNFDDEQTVALMKDVVTFWLDKGVDGFFLNDVEYMSRTPAGDAPNWNGIYTALAKLDNFMIAHRNASDDPEKELMLFARVPPDTSSDIQNKLVSEGRLKYVFSTELSQLSLENCRPIGGPATCIRDYVRREIDNHDTNKDRHNTWPLFELGNLDKKRVADRWTVGGKEASDEEKAYGRDRTELLTMLLLTLPGAVNHYYGDELPMFGTTKTRVPNTKAYRGPMQWNADANAGFSTASKLQIADPAEGFETNNLAIARNAADLPRMFKSLAELRGREDSLKGDAAEIIKVGKETVVLQRMPMDGASGKVYLTILNFADGEETYQSVINDRLIASPEGTVRTVVAVSKNARESYTKRKSIDLRNLKLPGRSGVVVRYEYTAPEPEVPAADEESQ